MGKRLKLAFVMGGGVSLGAFGSAAITEGLKQLILNAQYPTGEKDPNGKDIFLPYESVEIDVLSGASAGAISLGLLLRALVNHRDKYKLLGYPSYAQMREVLEQRLLVQYGESAYLLKQQSAHKWEQLVAVQTAQELQNKLWIEELNVEKLLGYGRYQKDLSTEAGFLDRKAVDNLAQAYLQFEQVGHRLEFKSHLLASRLLFCCTLANLNPILQQPQEQKGYLKALNDTAVDRQHSEKRVFDLHFQPISNEQSQQLPLKWVQYHQGDDLLTEQIDYNGQKQAKWVKNLDKNGVWREIAATVIASGAFPLAFEPVVLNRYQHEYGQHWPKSLQHLTKYPFTYVDGGLFNNEPIQEAAKLANYLDSQDSGFFDRKIIFADPNVAELEQQFQMGIHNKIGISRALVSGKASVASKSTFGRLLSNLPHLLTALLNESSARGLAGSLATSQQQESPQAWQQQKILLQQLSAAELPNELLTSLRQQVSDKLQATAQLLELPNKSLQVATEFWRIAREDREFLQSVLPLHEQGEFLYKAGEFLYVPEPNKVAQSRYWVYLLLRLNLELQAGRYLQPLKSEQLLPIAPFDFYKNDFSMLTLAGAGLAGFAGFASVHAGAYQLNYGRYAAYRILSDLGLIAAKAQPLPLPARFDYNLFDTKMKTELQNALFKRIKELVPAGLAANLLPLISGLVQEKIGEAVSAHVVPAAQNKQFSFRVKVSSELFSLRGFDPNGAAWDKNNLSAIRVNGEYFILAQLGYNPETGLWVGDNVNSFQMLYVDKLGVFSNSPSFAVQLPAVSKEALLSPNPVFIADASTESKISSYLEIKPDRWFHYSDIVPLDETLWGEDAVRNLYEKL